MMRISHISCVLAGLLILLAAPVAAQVGVEVHRLEIRDGHVYHDGDRMPQSSLPEGFDARGISFTFEYAGPVVPAITIDGKVYALEGNRLVSIEDASPETTARAIGVVPVESAVDEDERLRQAEEAYLATLSERDRALYERLMRERDMEHDAIRLSYAIRQSTDDTEREALREQLRETLNLMFDLKQENRLEEIQQVEDMLSAMREQVEARQQQRDDLIERRLRQLAGDQ